MARELCAPSRAPVTERYGTESAAEALDERLKPRLEELRAAGLYRTRHTVEAVHGTAGLVVDGRPCIDFSGNDYLGLRRHPEVAAAFAGAAERYGAGSGAAHLITGHTREHHALEEELADFLHRPRALLFSTGYMANLGIALALAGRGDTLVEDRLNHASLLDAARLSGARLQRYAHGDAAALRRRLERPARGTRLVATDGVFSMDGDLAPLPQLVRICDSHRACLIVDDAHGFGVLGARGAGTLEHFSLESRSVPVLMVTLGKAVGVFGAAVAGSDALIETLIQKARTYIYTTAPPAPLAAAARAALRLVRREAWRREKLRSNIERFRAGLTALGIATPASTTAIQPLAVSDVHRVAQTGEALLARGFRVAAIRPPTVPAGGSRLRVTLSAAHDEAQIDRLLDALAELRLSAGT